MRENWVEKAALFELLSLGLGFHSRETVNALVSGEFEETLEDVIPALGLDANLADSTTHQLNAYAGKDPGNIYHRLHLEYTRLFIGPPTARVSPYAGYYLAKDLGVKPLLSVSKESMAVERFMRRFGMKRIDGNNEPFDHIVTELEFLNYLCLNRAGVVSQEVESVTDETYREFYENHFIMYAGRIANEIEGASEEPLFLAMAQVVLALPQEPL